MDSPIAKDYVGPQSDLGGSSLHTRRNLLSMGAAGVAGFLGAAPASGARAGKTEPAAYETNVKNFGARGDGASDETAAFQRALDSAHSAGGGTVYAPPGRYLFRGVLSVPNGVTLRGSYCCVPSHTGFRDRTQPKPGDDGTALFATAGRGKEDGEPFITLNTNSSIAGLTIYYPEQVTDAAPIAYPWTIAMRGKNPAAFDLELVNPYQESTPAAMNATISGTFAASHCGAESGSTRSMTSAASKTFTSIPGGMDTALSMSGRHRTEWRSFSAARTGSMF